MQAIQKPYFPLLVLKASDPAPAHSLPAGYGLALELDLQGGQLNEAVIAAAIRSHVPFLLLVNQHTQLIDTRVLDILALCLFGKSYIQPGGTPAVAFLHAAVADAAVPGSLFSDYVLSKLAAQGWTAITSWHLSPEALDVQLAGQHARPLLVEHMDFETDLIAHAFLSHFPYASGYVFFRGHSLAEAEALEQAFWQLCEPVLAQNAVLLESLQAYIRARDQAQALQVKTSVLEERLVSAEKTISVIRSKYKDDYEQLFQWYHNEYEVLPLWYKRFGHILKVLMGKRTFKSLFFDHAKKYKS